MAIKYDGAVFETVEELVNYKKLLENGDNNGNDNGNDNGIKERKPRQEIQEKTVIVQQPVKAMRPFRGKNGTKWSRADKQELAELFWKHSKNGRLKRNSIQKIAKIIGRSNTAVTSAVYINRAYLMRKKPVDITTASQPIKSGSARKVWTQERVEQLAEHYWKHFSKKQLKRGSTKIIAKEMGLDVVTIKNGVELNKEIIQRKKPADTMIRRKPVVPTTYEEYQQKVLNKQRQSLLRFDELTQQSNKTFLDMLQFVVKQDRIVPITFSAIRISLERADKQSWSVSLWKDFCLTFIRNINHVCAVLNKAKEVTKPKYFRLVIEDKTLMIKHERGGR